MFPDRCAPLPFQGTNIVIFLNNTKETSIFILAANFFYHRRPQIPLIHTDIFFSKTTDFSDYTDSSGYALDINTCFVS